MDYHDQNAAKSRTGGFVWFQVVLERNFGEKEDDHRSIVEAFRRHVWMEIIAAGAVASCEQ
jgi:hypothetical protein